MTASHLCRYSTPRLVCLAISVCFCVSRAIASAPQGSVTAINVSNCGLTQTVARSENLRIALGHSIVWRGISTNKRIYVGDPTVLQVATTGPREAVLTARSPGISSFVVWNAGGSACLYNVEADVDPLELTTAIQNAFPSAAVSVRSSEGRIYLTGTVPFPADAEGVLKLAQMYSKEVVNSLRVVPERVRQVQLKLRIVEVDRTRLEQYGLNVAKGGKTPFSISTQQFGGLASSTDGVQVTDPLNLMLLSSNLNLGFTIRDLEEKQILQVLAEPTLTAMSGETAKFLSGGEFPFPVVQGTSGGASAAVTISFRPYGVKVDFAPTVNADGSIRLKVSPEVSTLDYSNAVVISGFTVPALSTRRADTEVEIRSGQSFAVSGLLDHRTMETLRRMPGIAGTPILGRLFTTKSYSRSVVELMVFVTATVVDPLTMKDTEPAPSLAVPNLDKSLFDQQLSKQQRLAPKGAAK